MGGGALCMELCMRLCTYHCMFIFYLEDLDFFIITAKHQCRFLFLAVNYTSILLGLFRKYATSKGQMRLSH